MPSWLSVSTSAITTLNRWIFQVTVWLMAIVVPVMLYEVIARYVFNAPTVWGMELAVLLFGPYFLLGGPYLLHLKGHVALDVARQRLSPAWQRRLGKPWSCFASPSSAVWSLQWDCPTQCLPESGSCGTL